MKALLIFLGFPTMLAAPLSAQNDECIAASPLAIGSTIFDNSLATDSLPDWSCGPGGADLWYSLSVPSDRVVVGDTFGSTFDTVMEVFAGNCSTLNLIECDDDSGGFLVLQSEVTWIARAGVEYLIRVGGFAGLRGGGGH